MGGGMILVRIIPSTGEISASCDQPRRSQAHRHRSPKPKAQRAKRYDDEFSHDDFSAPETGDETKPSV
jgi:hypothetical protein